MAGKRGMRSRKQWAYLFASKKPFAHKWAERVEKAGGPKTGYRALPTRTGVRKRV